LDAGGPALAELVICELATAELATAALDGDAVGPAF
jgi:hypothetical protein